MTRDIINQNGQKVDDELEGEVVWAIEHDKESFKFNGRAVEITKHTVDADMNKFTSITVSV